MQLKNQLFARIEPTIDTYLTEQIKSGKVKYEQNKHDDVVYYIDSKAKKLYARESWNFYTKPKQGTTTIIIAGSAKQLTWLPRLDVSHEVVAAVEILRLSRTYHKKKTAFQNTMSQLENILETLSKKELDHYYNLIDKKCAMQ